VYVCGFVTVAAAAGVSLSKLPAVLLGKRCPSSSILAKLCMAVSYLQREQVGKMSEQVACSRK
jgi:hypothetical protein